MPVFCGLKIKKRDRSGTNWPGKKKGAAFLHAPLDFMEPMSGIEPLTC